MPQPILLGLAHRAPRFGLFVAHTVGNRQKNADLLTQGLGDALQILGVRLWVAYQSISERDKRRRRPCHRRRVYLSQSTFRQEVAFECPVRYLASQIDALDHRLAVVDATPDPCIDNLLHEVGDAVVVTCWVRQVRHCAR